jgi:hypothetical protein
MNLPGNIKLDEVLQLLKDRFRRVQLSIFELAFLIGALLVAVSASYYYLTRIQPLNSELSRLESRETALVLQLSKLKKESDKLAEQKANDGKILESLKNFEDYLKTDKDGQTQIINEISTLGKTYRVSDGDMIFRPAEPDATTDANGNPTRAALSNISELKIYPVLGIDTTIIGDYQSLRKFLADLERSKQFLIINSLTFQGEADQGEAESVRRPVQTGFPGQGQGQLTDPGALPVTLKIELDTYFRKL